MKILHIILLDGEVLGDYYIKNLLGEFANQGYENEIFLINLKLYSEQNKFVTKYKNKQILNLQAKILENDKLYIHALSHNSFKSYARSFYKVIFESDKKIMMSFYEASIEFSSLLVLFINKLKGKSNGISLIQYFRESRLNNLILKNLQDNKLKITSLNKYYLQTLKTITQKDVGNIIIPSIIKKEDQLKAKENALKIKEKINPEGQNLLIGTFGRFDSTKGLDTLFFALKYLPKEYKLVIGGSLEKFASRGYESRTYIDELFNIFNSIKENPRDQYNLIARTINIILSEIINKKTISTISGIDILKSLEKREFLNNIFNKTAQDIGYKELLERVIFVSYNNFEEYLANIAACDILAFADVETERLYNFNACVAASIGKHVFLTHNNMYREFEKFYPECFHFFDVGNYIEFAQKVKNLENNDKSKNLDDQSASYNVLNEYDKIANLIESMS